MMNLLRAMPVLVLVLLVAAAPAGAAKRPKAAFYSVAQTHGSEVLEFHGDPAAGCAAHGTCGTSGTVAYTFARDAKRADEGYALLSSVAGSAYGLGSLAVSGQLTATVKTAGAADCLDTATRTQEQLSFLGTTDGKVRISVGAPAVDDAPEGTALLSPFATRCAGPLWADLARALPSAKVSRAQLAKPRVALKIAGDMPFSAGGFAGHVVADVRVTLVRRSCVGELKTVCDSLDSLSTVGTG